MLTFLVPGGIGDFSAMWEKLYPIALKREIAVQAPGELPSRITPFFDVLTPLQSLGTGHFDTGIVLNNCLPGGTDLGELDDGEYFLSVNAWMDAGRTVAEWSPGPTEYHYPFSIPIEMQRVSRAVIKHAKLNKGPVIGIYASAYGNVRHWNFWQTAEWYELISKVHKLCNATFVFIGAEYDLDLGHLLFEMCNTERILAINTIGQLHIGSTIEVIRGLDYFFSFPSGLGFLADVVSTPHVMWFPPHLESMTKMFPDPANLESKRTQHRIFETPEESFQNFKEVGMQFLEEPVCQK